MQIAELIALAKVRSGKQQQTLADEMGHNNHTRISKIARGVLQPDASEIVYLAEAANMDPIKVLAQVESERHPELAAVWKRITRVLRFHWATEIFAHRPRPSALCI